jgi:hypothetical protein
MGLVSWESSSVRYAPDSGAKADIARGPSRAKGLVWGDWCQGFSLRAISLFGRATTSPRPDLFFSQAAARSGGQGWPKAIAERLALEGREHSGRLARSGADSGSVGNRDDTEGELAIVRADCA